MSARLNRRRFLAISACAAMAGRAEAADWQGIVMGADARITLRGPAEQTRPALAAAIAQIHRIEAQFSLYRPDSALSRLNRAGFLRRPTPEFVDLMQLSARVHRLTDGLFDPTVQPLWRALARGDDPAPARAVIGWDRVVIDPDAIRLAPGQALTLNGIAQGFAADTVRTVLADHGLTQALVDLGEIAALGGPWQVGIGDPVQGIALTRHLTGTAIATSSPGALMLGPSAHILNPTGDAAPHWSTVSVQADSAALADGLSTALCFADQAALAKVLAAAGPSVLRLTCMTSNGDIRTMPT